MSFSAKIEGFIRKHGMIRPGDRVGVAVSGGADSVALLRALIELRAVLGCVLMVVHFNHKIRAEADADAEFVRGLAREFGLECFVGEADAKKFALERRVSLETAARELRYQFFSQLTSGAKAPLDNEARTARLKPRPSEAVLTEEGSRGSGESGIDKIATAHTLDDQAETVLMKLLRGAGTKGMSGIWPQIRKQEAGGERQEKRHPASPRDDNFEIVRPMLAVRRREVEQYLKSLGQEWREDTTNRDVKHTRNKIRHELLPLLQREYNPNIYQQLADAAEVARGEEEFWDQYPVLSTQYSEKSNAGPSTRKERSLGMTSLNNSGVREKQVPRFARDDNSLNLVFLLNEPLAVRRRLVRESFRKASGKSLAFEHTDELVRFLGRRESSRLQLPEYWFAVLDWPKRRVTFEERVPAKDGTGQRRITSKQKKKEAASRPQEKAKSKA